LVSQPGVLAARYGKPFPNRCTFALKKAACTFTELPQGYHEKCPDCGEITELYDFLIDKIIQAPEPGIPSVEVLSISPRDPNPDPNARSNYWHKVWACREARYRATYRRLK